MCKAPYDGVQETKEEVVRCDFSVAALYAATFLAWIAFTKYMCGTRHTVTIHLQVRCTWPVPCRRRV